MNATPSVATQLAEAYAVAREIKELSERLQRATETAAQALGVSLEQGESHATGY